MHKNRIIMVVLLLMILNCSIFTAPRAGIGRDDPIPPDLSITPQLIETELEIPENSEYGLTLRNTGRNDLSFEIKHQIIDQENIPHRDDPGDIVARFAWNNGPMNRYKHAAFNWTNNLMCLSTYSPNWLGGVAFDENYEEFEVVWEIQPNEPRILPMDFFTRNGMVYCPNINETTCYRYDNDGDLIDGALELPVRPDGMSYSNELELLIVLSSQDLNIHIYEFTSDTEVEEIDHFAWRQGALANAQSHGITWVDMHPDGQLWITAYPSFHVFQLSIDTEDWSIIEINDRFAWGGNQTWDGIAHDGHNLWLCGYNQAEFLIMDDGVNEAYWLSYEPKEGELEPNEEMEVVVTLDTDDLIDGVYAAELYFLDGDNNELAVVTVDLTAIGAPQLEISWNPGFPDMIDFNEQFDPDLFVGGPYQIQGKIENIGTAELIIESISLNGDDEMFSVEPTEFNIIPREEQMITVIFDAPINEPDEYRAEMVIASNDRNNEEISVDIHANADLPPIIRLEPVEIEENLETGQIAYHSIEVSNPGDAPLWFETEIEITDEPDWGCVPRRDDIHFEDRSFAVFQDAGAWGWLSDGMLDRDPLVCDYYNSYRNANDWNNVDFNDFDVIVIAGNNQSANFVNAYNNNLERLCEYLDDGGAAYFESAGSNSSIRPPGGFVNDQRGAVNGVLMVSPDREEENYSLFAEICHETQPDYWDEGEIIEGNSFLNSAYNMDQFNDALDEEIITWYEKIAEPQGASSGGVVSYGWGNGTVMLVGHNIGQCWINWTDEGQWGSISAEILYYLIKISSGGWAAVEPSYGEVEVDGDPVEVELILDADHLYEGTYEAEVHFHSNDPASPDEVVLVTIHVSPLPDLIIEWELGMGEDGYKDEASILDWNLYYETDVFVGYESLLPVTLINDGTTTLTISDVCSNEEGEPLFYSDFDDEIILYPEERTIVNLIFYSDEAGVYPENDDIRMIFYSDDPDENDIAVKLHAESLEPPIIAIEPNEIEEEMYGGERVDVAFTISNRGDAPLHWETKLDVIREGRDSNQRSLRSASASPERDDAGELLYTIRSPLAANNYKHFAYDYDNNWMWHSEYSGNRRVVAMDLNDWNPDEGELNDTPDIAAQWNHPGPSPMDFAYYDGVLYWMCLWNPWIQRRDREGNDLGNLDVDLDNTNVNGIAIDSKTGMMIVMSNTSPCHLYQFDLENDGERVGRMGGNGLLPGMGNEWGRAIDFVTDHDEAPLWSGSTNRIHQFEINRENEPWSLGNRVQNFERQATMQYDGLAHDGTNIWSCNYATNVIEVFDDGITEFHWLIWDPMEGSTPGGESSELFVTVNTSGLTSGVYMAVLHILNNDPENPDLEIPVNIDVEGIANIDVTPGGNEFNDEALDFGVCYIGYSKSMEISIENTGTEILEIEGVYFIEGSGYSIDEDVEFILEPDDDPVVLEVKFEPPEGNRLYEENIGFITNDPRYPFEPREERFGYPLHVIGNGFIAPEIRIARNAVEIDVASGDLEELGVPVQNVGGSPLVFETEVIIIAEPDRDIETARSLRSTGDASAPHRDEPGDIIASFQMPRAPNQAPTWAKNWFTGMMMASTWAGYIDIVDPDELEVVRTIQPGLGNQGDCAWLNGVFYVQGAAQNWAARFDNNLERLDGDLRFPYACRGMSADNENGWIFIKEAGGAIHVFEMDGDELGEEIGSFNDYLQYTNNQDPWTINWVPAHTEGELWVHTPSGGGVMSVDVDTDNWECVAQTYRWADPEANGNWYNGVGHDGNNVWVSVNANSTVWIMDDGIHEINTSWLRTDPSEATIEADEELEVTLCFNGDKLVEGDYQAEVHFLSNDPETDDKIVDVVMHIFARPILGRGTDPHPLEWGGEIIQFKSIIADNDNQTRFRIAIANGGLDDIEIDGMQLERNQEFEIDLDEDEFIIPPFEVFDLDILFHPERAGEFNDRLTFFSNTRNEEFDDGTFHFNMTGIGLTHPEITVDTDEIQADILLNDEEVTRSFTIGNNAGRLGADLNWRLTLDIIEEEERDAPNRILRGINSNDVNTPRRDQPQGRGMLIQNSCGWAAFNFEQYFSGIEEFDYDRYRNWNELDDIDFSDYNFIWIGNYEQEAWVRDYNENLERIEEFIDGGGALYHSSGTNRHNTRPINPGGLTYHWGEQDGDASQNDCPLQLDPEENFLINYMNENDPYDWEWREGQRLHGNGCAHGVFYEDELDEIENCNWWQIMALGNPTNEPIIVTYGYGRGFCVVSTTTDGYLHNTPASYHWGRTGEAMIWYLDELSSPSWIKVSPKSGEILAGEETEITITFTPNEEFENYSTYEAELTVRSDDPENDEVLIPVTLETGTLTTHFNNDNFDNFIETNRFHTMNISEFLVNDNPVPNGWEIGVFSEGEDIENNLCGSTVWIEGGRTIIIYGDDPGTEQIEGFSNGDQMSFRAWDPDAGENGIEWRVSIEFTGGPHIWVNHAESDAIITAHPVTQQILELIDGWNLISINVTPDIQYWVNENDPAPSMRLMLNEFIDEENNQRLIMFKDERGDFCSPEWEFIGINYWAAEEGYAVKVEGDYQLTYTGKPINPQTEIPLEAGWNYAAYYPTYELPCNFGDDFYALSSIIDHVIIAKDANGDFILSEYEFGYLTFSPGQGYQILVDEDVVLVYPEEPRDDAVAMLGKQHDRTSEKYWTSPAATGENMSLLITSVAGYEISDGDQIAAFNGDQLVGAGIFSGGKCGFAVWGDDSYSKDVIEGLTNEQSFTLKLWDADKCAIVDLEAKSIKNGDGLTYKTDAFTVLDVRVVETLPEEYSLSQNYPNPFNSVTRLAFDLPEDAFVTIEVFDVSGRKITNLVNRKHTAGRYTAVWNADNVTSGIYVIRMTAGKFTTARKMMLVR